MSMPSSLQILPNSAHWTVLRSHDRTYFCTYRFIQLAQWWQPTSYHFGIKSEVNNRLDFKIPNVSMCLTYVYNIVAKIKVDSAKIFAYHDSVFLKKYILHKILHAKYVICKVLHVVQAFKILIMCAKD